MTASTTNQVELPIDTIVRRAYQLSGQMTPQQSSSSPGWSDQASMARDFLEMRMGALQTLGLHVHAMDLYPLTLAAGTNPYTMPATTLDLVNDAMFVPTGSTVGTPVTIMGREEYQVIADKTTAGQPSRYYPHREVGVTVYLWPVPDADSLGTLTFQRHRLLATSRDGSATLAVERHWTLAVAYMLAGDLAMAGAMPIDRVNALMTEGKALADTASRYSRQRGPLQMVNDHSTPWSR